MIISETKWFKLNFFFASHLIIPQYVLKDQQFSIIIIEEGYHPMTNRSRATIKNVSNNESPMSPINLIRRFFQLMVLQCTGYS